MKHVDEKQILLWAGDSVLQKAIDSLSSQQDGGIPAWMIRSSKIANETTSIIIGE